MGSVVAELQARLEERGEYVVLANRSWFAVFESTWQDRLEAAKRQGRDGPNLIVHRTESHDPRDHHVIPYAVIQGLLAEETVTRSQVNGSVRWNLTLEDDLLHVSHRPGKVDVAEFHRARLLDEEVDAPRPVDMHEYEAAFKARVETSSRESGSVRRGRLRVAPKHPEKVTVLARVYARNPDVVAEVLLRANGTCELCRRAAPFRRSSDGSPYLEVHHKVQLANNGEDTVENAIAVCPNCHRQAHFGEA